MKKVLPLVAAFLLLIVFSGCSEECEPCPECPPENPTDVEPPFIHNINMPAELTVGQSADFSAEVLTDAPITSFNWDLTPAVDTGAEYFYPAAGTEEGEWTPSGEWVNLFVPDVSESTASFTYNTRGIFSVAVEIADTDGYVERASALLPVYPETPDTFADIVAMAPGLEDTIYGETFEAVRCGGWLTSGAMAAAYPAGYDTLHLFAYVDSFSSLEERYVHMWIETAKRIQVFTGEPTPADVRVDFDLTGAMHLVNAAEDDYVKVTVYLVIIHEDNGRTYHSVLTEYTIYGPEEHYYINTHINRNTAFEFNGGYYTLWVGVEVEIVSSQGNAAFCMDNADNMLKVNYIYLNLNK